MGIKEVDGDRRWHVWKELERYETIGLHKHEVFLLCGVEEDFS